MALLLENGVVLTLNDRGEVFPRGSILIEGGKIVSVGEKVDLAGVKGEERIDCQGGIVLPGLINAHCHLEELSQRSMRHGLPMEVWLPYKYGVFRYLSLSPDEVEAVLTFACAEMLRLGGTSVLHHFSAGFPPNPAWVEAALRAFRRTGVRAVLTPMLQDRALQDTIPLNLSSLPPGLRARLEADRPPQAEALLEWAGDFAQKSWENGRVRPGLGPNAPQRCSDALLSGCRDLSERHNVIVHTHVLETRVQVVFARRFYGGSYVEHLKGLGLLSERTSFAHCVWLSDGEIGLMGERSTRAVHNPASNLKLGSGIAPLRKMLSAGIRVGLGVDGGDSSDAGSVFDQVRLAALIHNVTTANPEDWVRPMEALRMATRGGAAVLGQEKELGSIEAGKRADLIILHRSWNYLPFLDPLSQLVFNEHGDSVRTAIVDGKVVMKEGKVLGIDEAGLREALEGIARRLRGHEEEASAFAEALRPHLLSMYHEACRSLGEIKRGVRL